MLWVNWPLNGTIYSQSNRFVTGGKLKVAGDPKLNGSPVPPYKPLHFQHLFLSFLLCRLERLVGVLRKRISDSGGTSVATIN